MELDITCMITMCDHPVDARLLHLSFLFCCMAITIVESLFGNGLTDRHTSSKDMSPMKRNIYE